MIDINSFIKTLKEIDKNFPEAIRTIEHLSNKAKQEADSYLSKIQASKKELESLEEDKLKSKHSYESLKIVLTEDFEKRKKEAKKIQDLESSRVEALEKKAIEDLENAAVFLSDSKARMAKAEEKLSEASDKLNLASEKESKNREEDKRLLEEKSRLDTEEARINKLSENLNHELKIHKKASEDLRQAEINFLSQRQTADERLKESSEILEKAAKKESKILEIQESLNKREVNIKIQEEKNAKDRANNIAKEKNLKTLELEMKRLRKITLFLILILICTTARADVFGRKLCFQEVDGSPSDVCPGIVKVSNSTLTDNGDGTATITTGGGGGGTPGGSDTQVQYNNASAFGGITGATTNGTTLTLTAPIISSISNTGLLTLPTTTDTIVGRATSDTLTNKTLTTPVIASITNTGLLTLPTTTDTLVGRATTDTLTNKTLTAPVISSITNTGLLTLPTTTDTIIGRATTDTLTNKRITQRVQSVSDAATVTPNADSDDTVDITAIAQAFTIANPSGTPVNFQKLIIRIKDNGTARAITFGSGYSAGGVSLPTTTVLSKITNMGFIYNTANSLNKWQLVALSQEA